MSVTDPLLIANASFPQFTSSPAPTFFEKNFTLFGGALQAKPQGWNAAGKFSWELTLNHPGTGKTYRLNIQLSRQITAKDLASDTRIFSFFKSKIQAQALESSNAQKTQVKAVFAARNSFLNTYHALIGELGKNKPDATTLDRLSRELSGKKYALDRETQNAMRAGAAVDNDAHFSYMLAVPYSQFGARLDALQRVASEASWNAQVRDSFVLGLFRKADQTATGLLRTSVQGYQLLGESIGNGKLVDAFRTLFNPVTGGEMLSGLSEDSKNFVVQWLKSDWQTVKKVTDVPNMSAGEKGAWAFDMAMVALDIYTLGQGGNMARRAGVNAKIVTRAELRLGRKLTKTEKVTISNGVNAGKGPAAYGQVLRDAKTGASNPLPNVVALAPTQRTAQPQTTQPIPPPTLLQLFESAKNARSLTINPVKGNPFRLEIRDLNGKHYVRLPDGKVLEFGEQVFLNKALKNRFGDKGSVLPPTKKFVPLTAEQAFKAGSNARSLKINTANGPIRLELRNFEGKIYVASPDGILVFKKPQGNLNAILKRRFGEVAPISSTPNTPTAPKQIPSNQRRLPAGEQPVERINPRNGSVSTANITASKSIAFMSAAELKEAAAFLVQINPSSYPNLGTAYKALKKSDQLYVMRDAEGALRGLATLTRDGPHSWYLGQVAGPRGFGNDIMKRILGDFEKLAKNQNTPVRIHAYTNKPSNIYDPKAPNGEGFYTKLGAEIRDSSPKGRTDLTTERRIDFEWNFPKKAKPKVQASIGASNTNTAAIARVPGSFVQQGVITIAAIIDNPLRPFGIPYATFFAANKVAKALAPRIEAVTSRVTAGAKVAVDFTGEVATKTAKRVFSVPKAIFDKLPPSTQAFLKELATGQKASTISEAALSALPPEVQAKMRNMIVLDEATWNMIPQDIQRAMEAASRNKIAVLQSAAAPITIAGAVDWSLATVKGGVERLSSFVATASNKVWNSPLITIPMNTSKVIGFVANKGVNALMVLEMATGGPKIHFYNPTSGAAITGPSIEALKMAYVPLTDGTVAVTLQAKMLPAASVTFWKSGPTMRNGLPRIDGRLSAAGDESLVRVINTWQANVGMVGVFSKVGVPNFHYLNGITFRPFGEMGANPLTGQSVVPVKGAGVASSTPITKRLEVTGLAVIDPPGFATTISTIRFGPIAASSREVLLLGPGGKGTLPATTEGVITSTKLVPKLPSADAIQPNPAVLKNPLDFSPYSPPTRSPNSGNFVPAEGALPPSSASNQAIYRLAVDPTSGWLALLPNGERTALMIKPDIANAMKTAAERSGRNIRTDFQSLYDFKSYDLVRALQSPTGVSAFKRSLHESLGSIDLTKPISIDAFANKFSDPLVRELIKTNPQFCLDLIR
jgi:hypothetical protein